MKLRSVKYLTGEGLKNLWVNRLMSIASIGVLVACMLLMGVAALFSVNVDKAFNTIQQQNVVMAYFKDEATEEECAKGVEDLKALDNVLEVKYVSREQGLERVKETMNDQYASIFEFYGEDAAKVLPNGAEVSFKDLEKYNETVAKIKTVANVQSVNDAKKLTEQIVGIRNIINVAGMWIIGLLLITALVIIANTVRITMHTRKLEISIMKAVGATNNFIRLPFIVEGVSLGIIAALFTTGTLYFVYHFSLDAITQKMNINPVPFSNIYLYLLGIFVLVGIATGVIGSMFSLGKYLRKEGSEFKAY